jgi:hypothetical protein
MIIRVGVTRVSGAMSSLYPISTLSIFGPVVSTDLNHIWLTNLLTLSLRDEGYSINALCALIQIPTLSFK